MDKKDNVVSFTKFRKQKGMLPPHRSEHVAVINDRYAMRLRLDGKLEILEAGKVIETREPTYPEAQLMAAYSFMEATIINLIKCHEPERSNDDYLTYPYVDWDETVKEVGPAAVAWNDGFIDEATVPMQRAIHRLMTGARQYLYREKLSGDIGLMPGNPSDLHREMTSNQSDYYFRFDDIDAVAGTRLKATMCLKDGSKIHTNTIVKAEIDIPAFDTEEIRARYLGLLLTLPAQTLLRKTINQAISVYGGTFVVVQ